MTSAIKIKNLDYYYDNYHVLKNIDFTVQKGDFFIIIGPNGSGKTTLIKIIAGIFKQQKGNIFVFDKSLKSYSRKKLAKKIALVPQMVSADFPFTVMELVLMGRSPYLGLLGLDKQEDLKIAKQALFFTGVEELMNRRMDHLSGGERQRILIAKAICQETEIILLDEPTAALDLAHQIRIMDLMEQLQQKKNVTIIMISHDINLAAMYGNRLLLLDNGKIASIGSPADVLTFKNLEKTYGCKVLIDKNPVGQYPRVNLVPQKFIKESK
ncbi:MAG: ABC transporter ATP-binding protein [Deltaproteobacteria bacterium]|nr:ABC transporter ATP-binding protein [Deltaproteobacteria bacterium]